MSCMACRATERLRIVCVDTEVHPKNGDAVCVRVCAGGGSITTLPPSGPAPACAVTIECSACGGRGQLRVEQLGPRVYARWFALER